jgi:hypothetical protein
MPVSILRRAYRSIAIAGLALIVTPPVPPAAAKPVAREARELLLEPARVYGHSVWFADELAPVADAVAEVLARPKSGGFRVVPPQEMRALWAAVQQGQLPEWKETCTAVPPPALLGEHLHPRAQVGSIEVRCTKRACKLVVEIHRHDPTPDGERGYARVARYGASLPTRESPAEWAARLRRSGLAPSPWPREAGGLGLSGTIEDDGDKSEAWAVVNGIEQSGGWTYTLDPDFFAAKSRELAACTPGPWVWRDWWTQSVVISVNGDGRMSRCEPALPDHLPPPEFACWCGVLAHLGFQAGAGERRASFDIHTFLPARHSVRDKYFRVAYLGRKRADDVSAILGTGEVDDRDLIACLGPVTSEMRDVKVPLHFTVRADGQATPTRVRWPAAIPRPAAACLDGVLARARFACPLSGHAEVDAYLSVSILPR